MQRVAIYIYDGMTQLDCLAEVMDWFRKTGENAEYVTSVCTGSMILAEAGRGSGTGQAS